eukprot:709485-Amphidinium_carterae.2
MHAECWIGRSSNAPLGSKLHGWPACGKSSRALCLFSVKFSHTHTLRNTPCLWPAHLKEAAAITSTKSDGTLLMCTMHTTRAVVH